LFQIFRSVKYAVSLPVAFVDRLYDGAKDFLKCATSSNGSLSACSEGAMKGITKAAGTSIVYFMVAIEYFLSFLFGLVVECILEI